MIADGRSDAAVHQAKASLIEAEQNAARAEQELPRGLISQREHDAALAARKIGVRERAVRPVEPQATGEEHTCQAFSNVPRTSAP